MSYSQGSVTYDGGGGAASSLAPGALNDGLSVEGGIGKLGQAVGTAGDPANVTEDREIPMNGGAAVYFGHNDGIDAALGIIPGFLSLYRPTADGGPEIYMNNGANNLTQQFFTDTFFAWLVNNGGSGFWSYDVVAKLLQYPANMNVEIDWLVNSPQVNTNTTAGFIQIDNTTNGVRYYFVDTSPGPGNVLIDIDGLPTGVAFKIAIVVVSANVLNIATLDATARLFDPDTGALVSNFNMPAGVASTIECINGTGVAGTRTMRVIKN